MSRTARVDVLPARVPSPIQLVALRRILLALILVTLFWGASLTSAPTALAGEERIHTVRPGETLSSIARRYGLNYVQLARYNGIANPNLVRPGQKLRIPASGAARPAAQPTRVVPTTTTRRAGQSPVATPAKRSTATVSTPVQSASSQATSTQRPTEAPAVGAPTSASTSVNVVTPTPIVRAAPTALPRLTVHRIHVVKSVETLSSIAAQYGTTVAAIKKRNGLSGDSLFAGQRLVIP